MESVGSGIPGFYCRVAVAVSPNDGATFAKRGPVLASRAQKNPKGPADQGVGEPWILTEPKEEFLYACYTSHDRADGRGVDIAWRGVRWRTRSSLRRGRSFTPVNSPNPAWAEETRRC